METECMEYRDELMVQRDVNIKMDRTNKKLEDELE